MSALLNGRLTRPPTWHDVAGIVTYCARRGGAEGPALKAELATWRTRHGQLVEDLTRGAGTRPTENAQPYRVDPWDLFQAARLTWPNCLTLLIDPELSQDRDRAQQVVDEPDPGGFRAGLRQLCQNAIDGFPARVRAADRMTRCAVGRAMVQVLCLAALLDVMDDLAENAENRGKQERTQQKEYVQAEREAAGVLHHFMQSLTMPPQEPVEAADRELLQRLWERWENSTAHMKLPYPMVTASRFLDLLEPLAEHEPELWFHAGIRNRTPAAAGTALAGLSAAFTVSPHPPPLGAARILSRRPSQELGHSLIESSQDHSRVTVPSLGMGYVEPAVRTVVVREGDPVHDDAWWREHRDRASLGTWLATHFTGPQAVCRPLLVLGHPGIGKSLLTRVLMARLPASDFLPVRVELRSVDADASVLEQITHSVAVQLDEEGTWSDVLEGAAGRIPVVLLDGLDELMQAGELGHWDYVEQVQAFQEREAAAGRPLAVVITSRTVVMDRCRTPPGCRAIYLEPFDTERRDRWLAVWNTVNRNYFAEHGLAELTPAALEPYRELAFQPLLLLLLALYDAEENDLARVRRSEVSGADLYEQLLLGFVKRQVRKHHPRPRFPQQVEREAEEEMARLSVVALAMFNRGRQSVGGTDVARDARALLGSDWGWSDDRAFGRFFFIHEAQAVRRGRASKAYEFLHATFSEYLVARSIWKELEHLTATGDGARLYALLAFALLTERTQVLERLDDLVAAAAPERRQDMCRRLEGILRSCLDDRAPEAEIPYEPRQLTPLLHLAYYSANVTLLHVLLSRETYVSDLLDTTDVPGAWRRLAGLWESQLDQTLWGDLPQCLMAERAVVDRQGGPRQDILLSWASDLPQGEEMVRLPAWTLSSHTLGEASADVVARRALFSCRADADLLALGIASGRLDGGDHGLPLQENDDQYRIALDQVLQLLLADDVNSMAVNDLEALYRECVRHLGMSVFPGEQRTLLRSLLLRALERDQRRLTPPVVYSLVQALERFGLSHPGLDSEDGRIHDRLIHHRSGL
ncbi:NACHT domain-containing protein [Streptomyces sp. NPDC101219]|uniref:NACHT domain-containing protein n=1 Tax=Streptomyces sp. NPDC101219 TaxID=3366131 RepID=UPI003812989C